jgi:hypothetical protein
VRTIFVHEHVAGGGLSAEALSSSLLAEGLAMLESIVCDLAACRGVEVVTTLDARLRSRRGLDGLPAEVVLVRTKHEARSAVRALAARAAATLLIAPEIDGCLFELAREVLDGGGRLLGGSLEAIRLAADKLLLPPWLEARGVPVLPVFPARAGDSWPFVAVLKPRFGAGSQGIVLLDAGRPAPARSHESVSTPLHDGIAASVLCVAGPRGVVALCPARQRLSRDGSFRYLGGRLPVGDTAGDELSERAARLARRAVEAIPEPLGFHGVDLLLGRAGAEGDKVVEINPRLATSYCGLRRFTRANLGQVLLDVADGREPSRIDWAREPLTFSLSRALVARAGAPVPRGAR